MDERKYTAEEVIEISIGMLRQIRVPAELAEEIGVPIQHVMENLRAVVKAFRENRTEGEEKPDGRDDQAE